MPDRRPHTIAELYQATVSLHTDSNALGLIENKQLAWHTWRGVGRQSAEWMRRLLAFGYEVGDTVPVVPVFDPSSLRSGNLIANEIAWAWLGMTSIVTPVSMPHEQRLDLLQQYGVQWLHKRREDWPGIGNDLQLPTLPQGCETAAIATVQHSSGTSGEPRYIALSHKNLVSNTIAVADTIAASLDEDPRDEVRLSFLPFSHLYARVCDLYCWIYRGSKLVLAESRDTIFRDCRLAKPTAINGVPYFFQKVIDVADREKTSIKKLLGGKIRRCYSGGAHLSPEVEQRFWDEGVPLLNGYGLSEASPVVTVSTIKDYKLGTVGKPLPGVDVRIADDGEVLVRGSNVMMGYWGPDGIDEKATTEVIRDGWLHTGDLGSLDAEGFLTIHGRKKETLVLSTGKNVSPSRIEALLAASPWIEQCAIVGDNRKHLAAVIVPNPDRVRAEVRKRRLWVWSKKSALRHQAIRAIFEQEIAERLAGLPSHEQVRAFTLLPRGFSQESGEMTAKLSLRRPTIEQSLSREIESLYAK